MATAVSREGIRPHMIRERGGSSEGLAVLFGQGGFLGTPQELSPQLRTRLQRPIPIPSEQREEVTWTVLHAAHEYRFPQTKDGEQEFTPPSQVLGIPRGNRQIALALQWEKSGDEPVLVAITPREVRVEEADRSTRRLQF